MIQLAFTSTDTHPLPINERVDMLRYKRTLNEAFGPHAYLATQDNPKTMESKFSQRFSKAVLVIVGIMTVLMASGVVAIQVVKF